MEPEPPAGRNFKRPAHGGALESEDNDRPWQVIPQVQALGAIVGARHWVRFAVSCFGS